MTEVDKKASGWRATFEGGKWVETAKASKPVAKAKKTTKVKKTTKAATKSKAS